MRTAEAAARLPTVRTNPLRVEAAGVTLAASVAVSRRRSAPGLPRLKPPRLRRPVPSSVHLRTVAVRGGLFSLAKSALKLFAPTEVNRTVAPARRPNAELRTGRAHRQSAAAARRRSAHPGGPGCVGTGLWATRPPGSPAGSLRAARGPSTVGSLRPLLPKAESGGQERPGAFNAATLRPPRRPGSRPGPERLGRSAAVWGNCPRGSPRHRLPLVALMPQWRQDHPNKRPSTHSTMLWPKWVVLIAGSTGSALHAVRPFQPSHHVGCPTRSHSRRECDGLLVALAPGHHCPRHSGHLVGERDGSDLCGPAR
jgi:hypothetical protein